MVQGKRGGRHQSKTTIQFATSPPLTKGDLGGFFSLIYTSKTAPFLTHHTQTIRFYIFNSAISVTFYNNKPIQNLLKKRAGIPP